MVENFDFKEKYSFDDLINIIHILRSPGGCPWDIKQTHASIKKDFIEETYEVIEAINKNDKYLLCEELGDVLLQVVFHADIAKSEDWFNIDDVADGICKKLIERHPHVFGEIDVDSVEQVLDNWDTIKRRTKGQKTQSSAMDKVPIELPALMRSQKIQSKAKKAGFDFENVDQCFKSFSSEIDELKEAINSQNQESITEEFGDVLFSCVNIARFIDVDAEEALSQSTNKFINRFKIVEALAHERKIDMKQANLEVLDELWNEAKSKLSNQRK